jgi:hypothetical protein
MRERTLDELIDDLVELQENGLGHLPVRVAWQPSYPLYASVSAVTASSLGPNDNPELGDNAIYLAGGSEGEGYLPDVITQELKSRGWS